MKAINIFAHLPLTLISIDMGSDNSASTSVVALHEYRPLSDCCKGLNSSWLVDELELMNTELSLTGCPGPSQRNVAAVSPVEHSRD